MKQIELSNNTSYAFVDDEDYEQLMQFKWHSHGGQYAYRAVKKNGKQINIMMHRHILNAMKGQLVDHKNGNGLDNRKCNLRFASQSQNNQNQKPQVRRKTSKFKGVSWHTKRNQWRAVIKLNGKARHLGYSCNEEECSRLYDEACRSLFGEFARPNKIASPL